MLQFIKKILLLFDKKIFNNFFSNNFAREVLIWNKIRREYPYSFKVAYKKREYCELNNLCDQYGSDKGEGIAVDKPYGWKSHSYADFYALAFGFKKNSVNLVLECGIGTNNLDVLSNMGATGKPGASLRVWRDYFPNAQIIGIDIDHRILFEEERIKSFYCDQTSNESVTQFTNNAQLKEESIDIIIDDGLHTFDAGRNFFESIISFLSYDGLYIIEDISLKDKKKYLNYFAKIDHDYSVMFIDLERPDSRLGDNSIILISKK
jgi:hypothetical protein